MFDSLWQKFKQRVLTKTQVKEIFQEKDLRKKSESDMSLLAAQKLLGHTTLTTTARYYRPVGKTVQPHSLIKGTKQT